MRREKGLRGHLAVLAVIMALTSGCQGSGAGTVPGTIPDTTATPPPPDQQATTTTTLTDEQAAYNVYRTFLDTSLAIGTTFERDPRDGSLAPYTTPTYRQQIVLNLEGLKRNGITQKGQLVTRLMSFSVPKANQLILDVCLRDEVDQFDRTGKQLTEPGIGTPQVEKVGLVKEGSNWLVDASIETEAPCDV